MEKKIISTADAPAAIGPYVQAVVKGNVLYASGCLGLDPKSGILPEGIEEQTKRALANVDAILKEAGFSKNDVVKTTVFIKDMNDFGKINAIYAEYFCEDNPARSCVEVAALPKGGLIEIEVVAIK